MVVIMGNVLELYVNMYIPHLLGSQMVEIVQFEISEPVSEVHVSQILQSVCVCEREREMRGLVG